jgi:hypothetical protein
MRWIQKMSGGSQDLMIDTGERCKNFEAKICELVTSSEEAVIGISQTTLIIYLTNGPVSSPKKNVMNLAHKKYFFASNAQKKIDKRLGTSSHLVKLHTIFVF